MRELDNRTHVRDIPIGLVICFGGFGLVGLAFGAWTWYLLVLLALPVGLALVPERKWYYMAALFWIAASLTALFIGVISLLGNDGSVSVTPIPVVAAIIYGLIAWYFYDKHKVHRQRIVQSRGNLVDRSGLRGQ